MAAEDPPEKRSTKLVRKTWQCISLDIKATIGWRWPPFPRLGFMVYLGPVEVLEECCGEDVLSTSTTGLANLGTRD